MLNEEESRLYTRALYGDRAARTAARMIVRGAGVEDGKQRCFAVILLSDFPMQDLNIDELWEGEVIFRPRFKGQDTALQCRGNSLDGIATDGYLWNPEDYTEIV